MRRTASHGLLANERTVGEALLRRPLKLLRHRRNELRASDFCLDNGLFHYDQLATTDSRVWGCAGLGSHDSELAVIRHNARHERWCLGENKPWRLVRERGYG